MSIRTIVNLSDQRAKRLLLDSLRHLEGEHRVEVVRYRPRRSDAQNRRYWPAIVEPFADWLSEQYGETVEVDRAHDILKETYLRVPVVNVDGEVICGPAGDPLMRTRSTTELNVPEFNEYMTKCEQLLLELCGITVD